MGLLRLKKDDNHKENTVGKIAKRRQIRKSTHAQIPILARFYSRIFRVGFIAFANSKKTAFASPSFFFAFKYSAGQFSQIVKILGDFIKAN